MQKTAFITGGTGFLGTNLIKALCEADWKVTALHRKTSNLKYIKGFPIGRDCFYVYDSGYACLP